MEVVHTDILAPDGLVPGVRAGPGPGRWWW
jgi:hypothetical protein